MLSEDHCFCSSEEYSSKLEWRKARWRRDSTKDVNITNMVDVEPIMVEKLGVNDQKDKIEDRDIKGGDKSLYGSWMLVKRKNIQKLHCKAQIY